MIWEKRNNKFKAGVVTNKELVVVSPSSHVSIAALLDTDKTPVRRNMRSTFSRRLLWLCGKNFQ